MLLLPETNIHGTASGLLKSKVPSVPAPKTSLALANNLHVLVPPTCTVLSPLSWPKPEREPWGILTPAWLWMEQLSSGHLLPVGRWMWLLKKKPDVSSVLQMKVCSLIHYEAKNCVYKCLSSWMVSRNTCSPRNVKMDIFGWQITSERSVLLSPLYHSLSFFSDLLVQAKLIFFTHVLELVVKVTQPAGKSVQRDLHTCTLHRHSHLHAQCWPESNTGCKFSLFFNNIEPTPKNVEAESKSVQELILFASRSKIQH